MFESGEIGVVISLAVSVGADHWRRGDDHFPSGIAGLERGLQPVALLTSPDGFFRAIGQFIGGAVVATFDEPKLQMGVHAVGAIARRFNIPNRKQGHLLPEELDAGGGCRKCFATEVSVVKTEVVIVL